MLRNYSQIKMMIVKGKKAQVQTGRSSSHANSRQVVHETQRHWPGLLPLVYQDNESQQYYVLPQHQQVDQSGQLLNANQSEGSFLVAGQNQLFRRELKMPKVLENAPSSSSHQIIPMSAPTGATRVPPQINQQYHQSMLNALSKNQFDMVNTAGTTLLQADGLNSTSVGPGEQQLRLMQQYNTQLQQEEISQILPSNDNHLALNNTMYLTQGQSVSLQQQTGLLQGQQLQMVDHYQYVHARNVSSDSYHRPSLQATGAENSDTAKQFTSLKTKIFNPQLSKPIGQRTAQVVPGSNEHQAESQSHSISYHSNNLSQQYQQQQQQQQQLYQSQVFQPQQVISSPMIGKSLSNRVGNNYQSHLVPAHILNPPRIDEQQLLALYHQQLAQKQAAQANPSYIANHPFSQENLGSQATNPLLSANQIHQPQMYSSSYNMSAASQQKKGGAAKSTGKQNLSGSSGRPAAVVQKPLDYGRQLRQKREQQVNNFIDLTYPKFDSLTMQLLQFNGKGIPSTTAAAAKSQQQQHYLNQQMKVGSLGISSLFNISGGGQQYKPSGQGVKQEPTSSQIMMPYIPGISAGNTYQANSVKVLSNRDATNKQQITNNIQKPGVIVVKDGGVVEQVLQNNDTQYRLNENPSDSAAMDPQVMLNQADIDTIQSINLNRPQTTVQLDGCKTEHLLLDDEDLEKQDNLSAQGGKTGQKVGTIRDTRQSNINKESMTQMMSEGSRDDVVLKPSNIRGGATSGVVVEEEPRIHLDIDANAEMTSKNESPVKLNIDNTSQFDKAGVNGSPGALGQSEDPQISNGSSYQNDGGSGPQPSTSLAEAQKIESAQAYGIGMVASSNRIVPASRRRQLLSIDSNNLSKKRTYGEDQSTTSPKDILSNTSPDVIGNLQKQNAAFVTGTAGTLNSSVDRVQYDNKDQINLSYTSNDAQVIVHPSRVMLVNSRQNHEKQVLGGNGEDHHNEGGVNTRQIDQRYQSAPAFDGNLIIKRCEFNQRQIQEAPQTSHEQSRGSKKRREIAAIKQQAILAIHAKSKMTNSRHAHHDACQRFLERGNKPVPLNYEEQDVLPANLRKQREDNQRGHQQQQQQQQQFALPPSKPGTKLNLGEFDEEINGINLSKLFSAYGPSSVVDPSKTFGGAGRKNRTSNGPRGAGYDSQSPLAQTVGSLPLNPRNSAFHPQNRKGGLSDDDVNGIYQSNYEEEDEDDPDFSSFDEPIIIRLMANMFSQKKSVLEGIEMLPEISVEKIRKELKSLKFRALAKQDKERRDQSQWELHKKAVEFMSKFPNLSQSCKNMEIMQFGSELSELRQNPFFLALKDNKVEQNRLQQIKELQMVMYDQKDDHLNTDDQKLPSAVEQAQTDIFKHTFVDAEADYSQPEQQPSHHSYILDRKAKDVFSYYDLSVELPAELFKHLGDYTIATENQKTMMKDFLHMHWPEMKQKKLQYKYAYHIEKRAFNVVVLGSHCKQQPWSKCCKIAVSFQFERVVGSCKVICLEPLCPYNPLDQMFMASMTAIDELFAETDQLLHSQSLHNGDVSSSVDHQSSFAPDMQHPKLKKQVPQSSSFVTS